MRDVIESLKQAGGVDWQQTMVVKETGIQESKTKEVSKKIVVDDQVEVVQVDG